MACGFMVELTNDDLLYFSEFEKITGTMPVDYVNMPTILIFLVEQQHLGKCIGKQGSTIQKLKDRFRKKVVVMPNVSDVEMFVKWYFNNITVVSTEVQNIMGESNVIVRIDEKDRGLAIGRDGERIKALKEILKTKFNGATVQLKTVRSMDSNPPAVI